MFFTKVFCLKKSGFLSFLGISGQSGHKNLVASYCGVIGAGLQTKTGVQGNPNVVTFLLNRNEVNRKPHINLIEQQYPYCRKRSSAKE